MKPAERLSYLLKQIRTAIDGACGISPPDITPYVEEAAAIAHQLHMRPPVVIERVNHLAMYRVDHPEINDGVYALTHRLEPRPSNAHEGTSFIEGIATGNAQKIASIFDSWAAFLESSHEHDPVKNEALPEGILGDIVRTIQEAKTPLKTQEEVAKASHIYSCNSDFKSAFATAGKLKFIAKIGGCWTVLKNT